MKYGEVMCQMNQV